jgi:hypothetical protein
VGVKREMSQAVASLKKFIRETWSEEFGFREEGRLFQPGGLDIN